MGYFRDRRTAKHQARLDRQLLDEIEIGVFVGHIRGKCMCCDAKERDVDDLLAVLGLERSEEGIVQAATPAILRKDLHG